jgi:hypothetical protein
MHHHNVVHPAFTTMPETQQGVSNQAQYSLDQSPNHAYQQQGVTMPAAVATPYRYRENEDSTRHDASPLAFSPPDGSHPNPQLRSWYSQDSSYTSESLRQIQLDTQAKRGETQGLPRAKRVLSPSESLPLNLKEKEIDSDEGGNMTKEIREITDKILEETSGNRVIKTDPQIPLDPNLVCPICDKQFRMFEIQKFKRHVERCDSK